MIATDQRVDASKGSMRAVQLTAYGDPTLLALGEAPEPTCGPEDLLVRVRAAGVNPIDAKIRAGAQRAILRPRLPTVLGMDVAGDVVAVGRRVSGFVPGDRIFASPNHRRMGGYAELASVPAREAAKMPASASYVQAASLPLASLTAWDALVRHGHVARGARVLIQAGAGGVGSLAIQLAKHFGAEVFATSSPRNIALLRELGADRPIDYTTERYEDVARDADLVVESLGVEHFPRAIATVRPKGRIVALTTGLPEAVERFGPYLGVLKTLGTLVSYEARAWLEKRASLRPILRAPDGPTLAKIATLVDSGVLRPLIDEVLPLEQAGVAHRKIESGRVRGKLVLDVSA